MKFCNISPRGLFLFYGSFYCDIFFAMFRHPRAVQRWFIERQFVEMTSYDCRINVGLSGGSELMKLLSGETRWPGACKSSQWFQLSHPPTEFVSATKDEKTKLRGFSLINFFVHKLLLCVGNLWIMSLKIWGKACVSETSPSWHSQQPLNYFNKMHVITTEPTPTSKPHQPTITSP